MLFCVLFVDFVLLLALIWVLVRVFCDFVCWVCLVGVWMDCLITLLFYGLVMC